MAAWGTVYDTVELAAGAATIVQVRRRGKGCLSYVIGSGDEAFVVDPSLDLDHYLAVAADKGWRITRVFDTHLHADHLSGARDLAAATGASLHLNPADTFAFDYTPLTDGDRHQLPGGVEMSVAALHTPGHTMGSTIYVVGDDAVLTGDTLFVDGVGRPDLADRAEEFAHNLYRSLQERVLTLPDDSRRASRPLRRRRPRPPPPAGRRAARRAAPHPRAAASSTRSTSWRGPPSAPRRDPPTTSRSSRRTWAAPRPPSPCSNSSSSAPTAARPPDPDPTRTPERNLHVHLHRR